MESPVRNRRVNRFSRFALLNTILSAWAVVAISVATEPAIAQQGAAVVSIDGNLHLTTDTTDTLGRISRGYYRVFENREMREGRMIDLEIVVLHASQEAHEPDPIFVLQGGPGVAAAPAWRRFATSDWRHDRDIVLVSQRGTDGDDRLVIPQQSDAADLQSLLAPGFDVESALHTRDVLAEEADLTQYSTVNAMDDLNDIRAALGYEQINLVGGSYGTRAALVYMRQHPDTVRSAILSGIAPIAFTNPLFHAQSAQIGLDLIFDEIARDPELAAVYPDIEEEFYTILKRLDEKPAEVTFTIVGTDQQMTLAMTREAFCEALRVMMYYSGTNRQVPRLIHHAFQGDYKPFARHAIESNRSIRDAIAFGMLLCVTCAEDVARIDPDTIDEFTARTFLGDRRVRDQMAICAFWPRSDLPENWGDPVTVDVPVLLWSGTHDPVTPPRWGEEAAGHLPNSLHLIVPGCHGVGGPCVEDIQRQFLHHPDPSSLDTSCIQSMRMPRIETD